MSKLMWNELTIDEMRDLMTYSSINSYDMSLSALCMVIKL